MAKSYRLAGMAGSVLLMLGCAAFAQEAQPVAGPETAPQQAAPQPEPASDCTGILCVFRSPLAPPPAVAAADPQTAPQDASATQTPVAAADPSDTPKPKRKPQKPVHLLTIAADPLEVGRLKSLTTAMPREKIRIVKADGATSVTDFSVSTTLAPADGVPKARLFSEQMHIIAKAGIQSPTDLAGKAVSFGPDKSVGQTAARKAFAALGVTVKETPLEIDNALDGLATGDIDAVVVLAPQPVDQLKKVPAGDLHFVSWPDGGTLPDGAVAASIDARSYPGLAKPGETIRAVGVDAVLCLKAKGAAQPAAKAFLAALSQHSAALSKRGFDLLKADLAARSSRRVADNARR